GLNPNAANKYGLTPLLYAFFPAATDPEKFRRGETARALLRHGARVLGTPILGFPTPQTADPSDYSRLDKFADDPGFLLEALSNAPVPYPTKGLPPKLVPQLLYIAAWGEVKPYGDAQNRLCRAAQILDDSNNADLWARIDAEVIHSLTVDLYGLVILRK